MKVMSICLLYHFPALVCFATILSDVAVGFVRHLVRWVIGLLRPSVTRKACVGLSEGRDGGVGE